MAEVLERKIAESENVANFVTLGGVELYGVYDPTMTTVKQVVDTFHDNYECRGTGPGTAPKAVSLYSEDLGRQLVDSDAGVLMRDLHVGRVSRFRVQFEEGSTCPPQHGTLDVARDLHTRLEREYDAESEAQTQPRRMFHLFVQTLEKTLTFRVAPETTVEELKSLILLKEGIPVDRQRLVFAGKQLQDGLTLGGQDHYNIPPDATLQLVSRLVAGMFKESSGRGGDYGRLKSCMLTIAPDRT